MTIPAQADDGSECKSGIVMIQAEIAKRPPPATLGKLETARREDQEGEFDECLDAVKDARTATGASSAEAWSSLGLAAS